MMNTAAGLVAILLFSHGVCSKKITCSVVSSYEGCTHFTCYTGLVNWSSISVETLKPERAPIAECSRSTKPICVHFTEVCNNLAASIQNGALSLYLQDARGTVYQCQIPGDQYQSEACEMDSGMYPTAVLSQGPVLSGTGPTDSEAGGHTTSYTELSSDKTDPKNIAIISMGCIIGVSIVLGLVLLAYKCVKKILSKKSISNDIEGITVVSPSTAPPAPDPTPYHVTPLTAQHTQEQATGYEGIAVSSNPPKTPPRSDQVDLPRTWGSSVTPVGQEEAGLLPFGASAARTVEPSPAAYEVNKSEEEDLEGVSQGPPDVFAVEMRSLLGHDESKLGHQHATHLATETLGL